MNKLFDKEKFLIISSQTTFRSGLRKLLTEQGAHNNLIDIAGDFHAAKELLGTSPYQIVISDDDMEKNPEQDLLNLHRLSHPITHERTFFLLVNEITPFLMADFVLKGGDAIITKPFKKDSFLKILRSIMGAKSDRRKDDILFMNVKDALEDQNLDLAMEKLSEFSEKDSFPYYSSQAMIHEYQKELDYAWEAYLKASHLKLDFRTLVNIHRVGIILKKYGEILPFTEQWLKNYPIHHSSITDITRVIIANQKYAFLDELFDLFTQYHVNNSFARVPLAAGFVLASASYLKTNNKEKSKIYALKAIEYSNCHMPILYKAIENLVRGQGSKEAEKAYLKFASIGSSLDEVIFDMKLRMLFSPKEKILEQCMKLLSQKTIHPELYQLTINCMKELGKDPNEILILARRNFPKMDFR